MAKYTKLVRENGMKLRLIKEWIEFEKAENNDIEILEKSVISFFHISSELFKEIYNLKTITNDYLCGSVIERIEEGKTYDELIAHYNMIGYEHIMVFLLDGMKNNTTNNVDTQNDSCMNSSDESTDEEIEEQEVFDDKVDISESIENFKWRHNQMNAIEETIKQGFVSGIHNHIMGAGKTYILFGLIQKHYDLNKCKKYYIVMCERPEILKQMLFDNEYNIDINKKKMYKDNGIIDLDLFCIRDCVNYKPRNVFTETISKPTIVLINNAFMKVRENDKLDKNNTALILLDECQSVSAPNMYDLLKKLKYTFDIHIIGFSATPLREHAEMQMKMIFSNSNNLHEPKKLNIISSYDYIHSTMDGITLPFKYYLTEVRTKPDIVDNHHKLIVSKIFNNVLPSLPYKKIIAWCRTIKQMKEWYKFFNETYEKLTVFMTSCRDSAFSSKYNCEYNEFCKSEGNCILLCVNRCREGVDIKHVDCGIYLGAVKKRSVLVSMQTAGRVIRPDKEKLKRRAVIIEMCVNDTNTSKQSLTIDTIVKYYMQILNLTNDEIYNYREQIELYNKILELRYNTSYNEDKNQIVIRIDDDKHHNSKIQLTTKSIDWVYIKEFLEKEIDRKFQVKREDKFKMIIEKFKTCKQLNVNCDFWKVYDNVREELDLPYDFRHEYADIFDKKTWYEILGYNTNQWYGSIKSMKNKINGVSDRKSYNVLRESDKMLPPYPQYVFKYATFKEFIMKINSIKMW